MDKLGQHNSETLDELPQEPKRRHPSRSKFSRFITNKKFYVPVALIVAGAVLLFVYVKPVRYAVLNAVTDTTAEVVVLDETTQQPLAQATLTIQGKHYTTDDSGKVKLTHLDFGETAYTVQKDAYAPYQSTVTFDLGATKIDPVLLHPTGTPLEVSVTNKLSGEAINNYEVALSGTTTTAKSNEHGVAVLSVLPQVKNATLVIKADGFGTVTERVLIKKSGSKTSVKTTVTPVGTHYFLSNREGSNDIYASNLDGSNQRLLFKGGTADDYNLDLVVSENQKYGVFISTRDKLKGTDGDIQPALFTINFATKSIKRVDEGTTQFRVIGWADDATLIYTVETPDYQRKIKTVDVSSGKLATLAKVNSYDFNHYQVKPEFVYYTDYAEGSPEVGLHSINALTKAKRRITTVAPSRIANPKPDSFFYLLNNVWKRFDLSSQTTIANQIPDRMSPIAFVLSPNRARAAWVENRDGVGVILVGDTSANNPKRINTSLDVSGIVRWVDDKYLIVNTRKDQSADYIVHLGTGKTTKISSVYTASYYGY